MTNLSNMIILTISHCLYLTDDQIDILIENGVVDTVGVSVPVWFKMGSTSEPAQEVFCRYTITNSVEDYFITTSEEGYQFNVPQLAELNTDTMTFAQQRLRDLKDGSYLSFKNYKKIRTKNNRTNVVHIISICRADRYVQSLTY